MKPKILVVDDEVSVCRVLRKYLESKGFEVREAYNGKEALEVFRHEAPDLVLLDIRMPGRDGLDALRDMKAFNPDALVIMVTAVHEEEIALKAMAEGASDYITKPIDPKYLEMTLRANLSLHAGGEERNTRA